MKMRTEKQIYDTILNFAKADDRIRVVTLEGSRTNINIIPDDFQDYDITFFVTDMQSFINSYVVKGLCRKEILFAIDHLNNIVRMELLRMISWKVGIEQGYSFSLGKNYKFLERYISPELWKKILATYNMGSYTEMWKSLELCMGIFRMVSKEVAQCLNYLYPDYDKNISNYVIRQKEKYQR